VSTDRSVIGAVYYPVKATVISKILTYRIKRILIHCNDYADNTVSAASCVSFYLTSVTPLS